MMHGPLELPDVGTGANGLPQGRAFYPGRHSNPGSLASFSGRVLVLSVGMGGDVSSVSRRVSLVVSGPEASFDTAATA